MTHLLVHYLDTVRHFIAYAFQPYAWVPNISAAIIQAAVVVAVVKVFRKRAEAWLHRVTHKLLKPHLDAIKDHVSSELAKVKGL